MIGAACIQNLTDRPMIWYAFIFVDVDRWYGLLWRDVVDVDAWARASVKGEMMLYPNRHDKKIVAGPTWEEDRTLGMTVLLICCTLSRIIDIAGKDKAVRIRWVFPEKKGLAEALVLAAVLALLLLAILDLSSPARLLSSSSMRGWLIIDAKLASRSPRVTITTGKRNRIAVYCFMILNRKWSLLVVKMFDRLWWLCWLCFICESFVSIFWFVNCHPFRKWGERFWPFLMCKKASNITSHHHHQTTKKFNAAAH